MADSPYTKKDSDFSKKLPPSEAGKEARAIAGEQKVREAEIRDSFSSTDPDFLVINDVPIIGASIDSISVQTDPDIFVAETMRSSAPIIQSHGTGLDMVNISLSFPQGDPQVKYLRRIVAESIKHPFIFVENQKIRQALAVEDETMIFALHNGSIRSAAGQTGVVHLDLQLARFNYKPFSKHFWYNSDLPGSDAQPRTSAVTGDLLPGEPIGREIFDYNVSKFADLSDFSLSGNYEANTPVVFPGNSKAWLHYADRLESQTNPLSIENHDYVGFRVTEFRVFNPPEGAAVGEADAAKVYRARQKDVSAPEYYLASEASKDYEEQENVSRREQKSRKVYRAYANKNNPNSAVYEGPNRSLQVRDEELIWIARGIVGEGSNGASREECAAYLWAIMNRCLIAGGRRSRKSYGQMWLEFSQPINIRWLRTGDFCQPGGKYHGTKFCSERRLSKRERHRSRPWKNINKTIRTAVLDFQAGRLPRPKNLDPRTSNWASLKSAPEKFPKGKWAWGEWFCVDGGAENRPLVKVHPPEEPISISERNKKNLELIGRQQDSWDAPRQSIPEENKTATQRQTQFDPEAAEVATDETLLVPQSLDERQKWIQDITGMSVPPEDVRKGFGNWNYYYNDDEVRNVFFREAHMDINGGASPERNIVCTALSINFGHRLAQQKFIGQPNPSWQFLGAGNKSGTFVLSAADEEGRASLQKFREFYEIAQENARLFNYVPDSACVRLEWSDNTELDAVNNILALANVEQVIITGIQDQTDNTNGVDMHSLVVDWVAYDLPEEDLTPRDAIGIETKFAIIRKLLNHVKSWDISRDDPRFEESTWDKLVEWANGIMADSATGMLGASMGGAVDDSYDQHKEREDARLEAAVELWMKQRAANHFIGPKNSILQWTKEEGWTPVGKFKEIPWFVNLVQRVVKILVSFKDAFPDFNVECLEVEDNVTWERRLIRELGSGIVPILNGSPEPIGDTGIVSKGFWYSPNDQARAARITVYYNRMMDRLGQVAVEAMKFVADAQNFKDAELFGPDIYNQVVGSFTGQLKECYKDMDLPDIPGLDNVPLPPEFYIYDDSMEDAVLSETNDPANLERMIESHILNEAKSIDQYTRKLLFGGKEVSANINRIRQNKINLNEHFNAEYDFMAINSDLNASAAHSLGGQINAMVAEGIRAWDAVIYDKFEVAASPQSVQYELIRDEISKYYEDVGSDDLQADQKRMDGFLNMVIEWTPHLEYWADRRDSSGRLSSQDRDSIRSIVKANAYSSYTDGGTSASPLSSIEFGPNKENADVDAILYGDPNPNAEDSSGIDPESGKNVKIEKPTESDLTKAGQDEKPQPAPASGSPTRTTSSASGDYSVTAPAADDFNKNIAKAAAEIAIRSRKKDLSMRRAYPTFKIYFIDEDEQQGNFNLKAYDDFYGYAAVQEIKVIRSRKVAADLAVIRITNVAGKILTKRFERDETVQLGDRRTEEHAVGILAETREENPYDNMMLQPGVKIQIRLGYSADPDALETVFLGQITELMPNEDGNIIEVVCQGYGAELEAGECGDLEDPILSYSTQMALSSAIIQPYITHFGRRDLNKLYNPAAVRSFLTGGRTEEGFVPSLFGVLKQEHLRRHSFLNDPQDDNIYAPPLSTYIDAWDSFWNNAAIYRPLLSSPWEIFKEHELRHPGYVSLAVPYGHSGRMTMFFGAKGQNYWKHPPTEQEIALSTFLSKELMRMRYLKGDSFDVFTDPGVRAKLVKLKAADPKLFRIITTALTRSYGREKSIGFYLGRIFGRYVPFRNYHMFTSEHHILKNEIRTNALGTYNTVEIRYSNEEDIRDAEGEDAVNKSKNVEAGIDGVYTLKLNDRIPDDLVRKYVEAYPSCITEYMAQRYAQGLLLRGLKDTYRGELVVTGEETLKPYDICMLQDNVTEMYGPCEVEQVVHIFNRDHGFISIITPDLCVDFNDFTSKGVMDAIVQTTSLLYALSNNATVAAAQKAVRMSGSLSSKFIGAMAPILGAAMMMHFDQTGSPFVITPLNLGGKPMLGLALAPKYGGWFQNIAGRWRDWTEDLEEGWAETDFTESILRMKDRFDDWALTLLTTGRTDL